MLKVNLTFCMLFIWVIVYIVVFYAVRPFPEFINVCPYAEIRDTDQFMKNIRLLLLPETKYAVEE